MKPTHQQSVDFLSHLPVPGVAFQHNDNVSVIGGEHAGDSGSLINILELGADPLYTVELESNQDASIRQSHLQFICHQ
jgi:hypothetical protein